jgi:hypothetical protein
MGTPPAAAAGASAITDAALRYYAGLPAAPRANKGPEGLPATGPAPEAGPPPCGRGTHAGFDLSSVTGGPFPSDRWTAADPTQNTGRRVNLPLPDPVTHPSDYQDTQVLNTLDGFNLQPRLSIPFDGPIDVNTVSSQTVFLVSLGDTLDPHDHGGQVVGINQVVWDPATNTLHAESDELLDQHTRYALIVTCGVQDTAGNPVGASEAFRRFRHEVRGEYKHDLLDAVHAAHRLGIPERDIVTASVFTTQSITAVLEKIRDQVHAATPAPADFLLGPGGTRTVFDLNAVSGITFNQQTRVNAPLTSVSVPLSQLQIIPGAVGQIAFGKYLSPDYLTSQVFIPPVGTRTGTPVIQSVNEVYFNLYLPSGTAPTGGWPVAIFGHGRNGDKNFSMRVAATMAAHGIATIAINAAGHGFGPLGTLTVTPTAGSPVTFAAGGRGIDLNGDQVIGASEGWTAAPPREIIGERDGNLQTVVDFMQLARVIEAGMDVDGNRSRDLDPSRVFYVGFSMGGIQGAAFLAVEPAVRAGALNSLGAGGDLTIGLLSPLPVGRPAVGTFLQSRTPSLLNSPGLTSIGGIPVGPLHFNENIPLRNQPPVINTVAGAMEIQELVENTEWVRQSGDPGAYAPHLRKDPLPGVPARPVIIQFARGDQNIANPLATAVLRAGDLADRATFFRNDLAFAENPAVPKNPHRFMVNIDIPAATAIALGAQEQIATFFDSDGTVVIHPEPSRFFGVPIAGPLPEDLNYIV